MSKLNIFEKLCFYLFLDLKKKIKIKSNNLDCEIQKEDQGGVSCWISVEVSLRLVRKP